MQAKRANESQSIFQATLTKSRPRETLVTPTTRYLAVTPLWSMPILRRFLQPWPGCASQRAYSFFSSKPGGGRYFNSSKPTHKVVATPTRHTDEQSPSSSSPTTPSIPSDEPSSKKCLGSKEKQATTTTPTHEERPPPEQSSPRLPLHPSFSSRTYPLHQIFAMHRPLLTVSQPTTTLFESLNGPTSDKPFASRTAEEDPHPQQQLSGALSEEAVVDADADAARQLSRALAINHLGSAIDWEETLMRLGDPEALRAQEQQRFENDSFIELDSTKRKRRKKMTKHR